MPAETDKYVVAMFALWAGDFAFFERLLREFSPPSNTPPIEEGAESPEDFIRATGALRLRQFWRKRGEFKMLAAEYAEQGIPITEQPLFLETMHLRATVWRTGEREFTMQGYLKDLGWQVQLFERARREAGRYELLKRIPPSKKSDSFEPPPKREPAKIFGVAWTIISNPFIQVELTDLGLLEASALWTEPRLPEDVEVITEPLLRLLKALDEPPDSR